MAVGVAAPVRRAITPIAALELQAVVEAEAVRDLGAMEVMETGVITVEAGEAAGVAREAPAGRVAPVAMVAVVVVVRSSFKLVCWRLVASQGAKPVVLEKTLGATDDWFSNPITT